MDINSIKEIVEMMKSSELSEFELEANDIKLRISRNLGGSPIVQAIPQASAPQMSLPQETSQAVASPEAASDDNLVTITSPMIGVFYRAPSPDSPMFADKGTRVNKDSVVCIVEAMKVMNEIQAECSGEIVEILVENEQSVEFGQPLFKVKPA